MFIFFSYTKSMFLEIERNWNVYSLSKTLLYR